MTNRLWHLPDTWGEVRRLKAENEHLRVALRNEVRRRYTSAGGSREDDAWLDEYIAKTYPAVEEAR